MAPNESHYVKWNKTHKKGCDLINDLISACNLKQEKNKHWAYRSWEQNGSYSRLGGNTEKGRVRSG